MTYPHDRPFAPIHERLPYSAIVDRDPICWPGGAKVAVWVVVNLEHYEYLPPPSSTDPYPRTPHPDVRKYSYHDYGNRVGFWRMLQVLDSHTVPCTASINVSVFDHYPEVAAAARDREWDFMSHGMYNTRYLTGLGRDDELDLLYSCNRVLERHTGRRFDGMLGPNITGNWWTPDLMAEVGMRYQADWVHDERPSPLITSSSTPFVAMPYNYELNDAPLMMRSYFEGPEYVELVKAQFDQLLFDAATGGRLMCVTLHPFATGQPHRIQYLDQLLEHLGSSGAVWFARAGEIVDHYLANYWDADFHQCRVAHDD